MTEGTKAASGIIGTFLGPRSPGTAYVLLHHYMGEIDGAFRAWGIPKGGTGGISDAIGRAAAAQGAEIRLEAPVARILVRDGRATGVVLESGEEILAGMSQMHVEVALDVLGAEPHGTDVADVRAGRDAAAGTTRSPCGSTGWGWWPGSDRFAKRIRTAQLPERRGSTQADPSGIGPFGCQGLTRPTP